MVFANVFSEFCQNVWGILTNSSYSVLLISGLKYTLIITFFSLIFSTLIGIGIGYLRSLTTKQKNIQNLFIKIAQWLAKEYIDIIRGTPLIVQAFFFYFALMPMTVNTLNEYLSFKVPMMNAVVAGIIIISLNAGAYMAEIFRAGIQAIDKGQMEAARSLGLPYKHAMRKVILPQAVRNMIPTILNQFIISLKDTSLLTIIGVPELAGNAKTIAGNNYKSFETYLIVGLMYYIIIKILSHVFRKIEGKLQV